MKSVNSLSRPRRVTCTLLALLLCLQLAASATRAQSVTIVAPVSNDEPASDNDKVAPPPLKYLRLERVPVAGGAELLTIFGSLNGLPASTTSDERNVPLVSILRDTLGDSSRDNDRLRYVWMHTYTRPSAMQRAASAIPFLYSRVGNRRHADGEVPPPVIDLSGAEHDVWQKIFWSSLQAILIDPVSLSVKASSRTYRRNLDDYRKAHVMRALAILALYEETTDSQPVFNAQERREIQARLMLTQKNFGGVLDDLYLQRVERHETSQGEDARGHNWEMLRQRAEAEGLYFEPLTLPDGSATHALLWTTREDVAARRDHDFERRFLNIANPWRDERLRAWQGYTEARYFDADGRRVAADAPGAHKVEMIPLALYGLDHPKIPILLVDFRDTLNPKGREMTRRILNDVARNIFAFSRFDLAYLLGRTVYDWVTDRRGMDINQPSRLRAYSQLKLLLSLDASLDPKLRAEINERLELVSLNPLENDRKAEAQLAHEQYAALLDYARRPDGLAAKLDRDRRAELVKVDHSRAAQTFFKVANTISFGLYTHREETATTTAQFAALDTERTLEHHRKFLREVAKTSAQVEVEWNIADVRRSLEFLAAHGERVDGATSSAVARIFAHTSDEEVRKLCLNCLYHINNESAKNSLVRIYRDETVDSRWRALSADYLRAAARDQKRISAGDAKIIAAIGGNE
jgi:hypothetical protein